VTIGVFDSGVGGLTVTREIRALLPEADLVYIGDSVNAPYGPRSEAEIQTLSAGQARYLVQRCQCELIVVACNTATAAAVTLLRETFPETPIVGMEPAVKPAVAATQSGIVGVLATVGTLKSAKLAALLEREGSRVRFLTHSCPGWVEAIECGALETPATRHLIHQHVVPLLAAGADTLVLGCTHFPALRPMIQAIVGPTITLIDTGQAVARRVQALIPVPPPSPVTGGAGWTRLRTTGDPVRFSRAAQAILGWDQPPEVTRLAWRESELTDAESGWTE
jgi:glutamate racemase